MVISATAFNRLTRTPIVLPITQGGDFARRAGFTVPLAASGTQTAGVVRCDQPRAIDLSARGGRFVEKAPDFVVADAVARLAAIVG